MSFYGLTFNNIHSSQFNAYLKSKNRMTLPARRKREIAIPGKDGTYDFGGNTFDNKVIEVQLTLNENSLYELRRKARQIAAWLSTSVRQPLIFDDEPDKYYLAKVYDSISPEEIADTGIVSVKFECEPFAYLLVSTAEEITWGSNISWGSDVTWGNSSNYTFSISSPKEIMVDNPGTYKLRPVIVITGSFSSISISVNGKTFNYTEAVSNETVTINNAKYTVKKGSVNKLNISAGDFLELNPGENDITVSGADLNCTITIDFKPLYL